MREGIASLPEGEVYFEDYLETFPQGRFEPLLLPLSLRIQGDRLTADFTGASPQVPAPVNSTLAVTAASVFITLKSVPAPHGPLNHRSFRPLAGVVPRRPIAT